VPQTTLVGVSGIVPAAAEQTDREGNAAMAADGGPSKAGAMAEHINLKWLVAARCLERLIVAVSAAVICYLGYRLYALGVEHGPVEFSVKAFVLKGTGPGLAFMGGGVFLLWRTLRTPIRVTFPGAEGESAEVSLQGAADRGSQER
jgi:hypothetical protein